MPVTTTRSRARTPSARDQLKLAIDAGLDGVLVVGGDGALHGVLDHVADSDLAFGLIPAGTGNDTARSLGIPVKDVNAAVDLIIAGHVRTIDLARAGEAYVATVDRLGLRLQGQRARQRMTWPRGNMRYNIAIVAELREFEPLPFTLTLDGKTIEREAMLVAVGNGPSFGGGIRICEGAKLDDGLLDVVVINPVSKGKLMRVFPKLYKGTHVTMPEFERHLVREVTLSSPGIVAYGDGERLGPLPMTTTVQPGALRVFAPPAPYSFYYPVTVVWTHDHPGREVRKFPRRPDISAPGRVPRPLRVRARRLPGRGVQGRRGRPRRPGRRTHRLRQDTGRRVRRAPGPRDRPQVLLHDADQGAVQPEVRRPRRPPRRRERRAADRRQHDQRRGAGRRDDDRGPAQHALRRLAHARHARLRRDGRGALPRRPHARRRVGGSHHPPAGVGLGHLAVGDGVQRRGVRRLADRGARRHRHDRRGAPPRTPAPARARGPQDVPAVRVERRRRGRRGQPGADPHRARRLAVHPHAQGPARARAASAPAAGTAPRAGSRSSSGSTPRGSCRRSASSSAAPAALPRSSSASTRA